MRVLVGLLAACSFFVLAPAANAHHSINFALVGTAGTNGWFRSNVTIQWQMSHPGDITGSSGCEPGTQVTSEGVNSRTCTATAGDHTVNLSVTVRIDKSAPTVSGGTPARAPDSNGWYNKPVAVAFGGSDAVSGLAGCSAPTYAGADGGPVSVAGTCTDVAGNVGSGGFALNYDATPPSAGVSATRAPDSNGWYNHPVEMAASGGDATSGVAGCSAPSYAGPDNGSATVGATCSDRAGNSATATMSLRYDSTAPSVSGNPDRAPTGGWYRKPFNVSFAGADALSRVASCTGPVQYKGPDGPSASVKGSCTDAAGNSAEGTFGFKYDATAPKLAKPRVERGKNLVRLVWQRPADFASASIVRRPGLKGKRSTVVYSGKGGSFADRTVKEGVRYRYELRVVDIAGNVSGRVLTASSRLPLYRPEAGARVRAPVSLAWDAQPGARFYNVQMYRNGTKVLSLWPAKALLRLGRTWRYAGKTQRLQPGPLRLVRLAGAGHARTAGLRPPDRQQLVRRQRRRLETQPVS